VGDDLRESFARPETAHFFFRRNLTTRPEQFPLPLMSKMELIIALHEKKLRMRPSQIASRELYWWRGEAHKSSVRPRVWPTAAKTSKHPS
jgi:hypothetical protein